MAYVVRREDVAGLHSEWTELLSQQPEPVAFLHPTWQQVWLEEFQDGRELLLFSVRDEGKLVGVAPLLRTDDRLSLVGHQSICDYMDFVIANQSEDCYRAVFDALLQESWSELDLRGLRDGSATLTLLPQLAQAAGLAVEQETESTAPRVSLPGSWDEYLALLSKKDRHELRRKLRRLQAAGELELRIYTDPDDVETHLPVLLRFMVESRTDKADFLSEQMGLFFHKATQALAQHGLVRLYELELDATPVASVLCFDQGGQLYMYNSGYDPEYAAMSAGVVSKAFCLQDAIESGRHCVDMLRGDESYKYKLGGEDQAIYRCVITRA